MAEDADIIVMLLPPGFQTKENYKVSLKLKQVKFTNIAILNRLTLRHSRLLPLVTKVKP